MQKNINLQNLKWIIYCRKSSDTEDKQIESLPAQVRELKELAKHEGYKHIVKVYQESHSAFHPGRPLFNEMMQKLYNGEADAVLTWAGNRIARNPIDAGAFIYAMDQGKITAIKTKGGRYFNTPEDKFALNIDFTVSKKSSDDLSEAVLRGNRTKFHENKEWGGHAKQGFINYTDPFTKKRDLKICEERFNLLQRAGKFIVNNDKTPLQTLDWLNITKGYTTVKMKKLGGGPLSESAFYKLLSDPFYYGLMIRKIDGQTCEEWHKYPKMFSKEEWDIIQIRLGKKSRSKQGNYDFAYKGPFICGECNGSITAENKWQIICPECKKKFAKTKTRTACPQCHLEIHKMEKPKLLHYIYYHCTKKVNEKCTQKSISLKKLESMIDTELMKFSLNPVLKDWLIDHLGDLNEAQIKEDEQDTKKNIKNYEELKSKLRRMTKSRFTDWFENASEEEKEAYEAELVNLKTSIEVVKQNINETDQTQQDWIELSKQTYNFAAYSRYWLANGDIETKTKIFNFLGSNPKLLNSELLIDGEKRWWFIEKAKQELRKLGIRLEPTKIAGESDKNAFLQPAIPTLLRDWESNPACEIMSLTCTVHYPARVPD